MPALTLVPFQLSFEGFGVSQGAVTGISGSGSGLSGDLEKEQRSGRQWLKSVESYCLWRAGESWRKVHTAEGRWNAVRWEYLDAARLITDILLTKATQTSRYPIRMISQSLQAVVLTHLPFEDLGTLEPRLLERGFQIQTIDVTTAHFPLPQAASCDLLIVLGGPIGVYDAPAYPFLTDELDCIRRRLEAKEPTLGICLGAQLMAGAMGARVYPGERGPEIGWFPIQSPTGSTPPEWFKVLFRSGLHLFHWHGDTFDMPAGAICTAETQWYCNQAFSIENFALGLQFHPEVTAQGLERWYVGHAWELASRKISVPELRAGASRHASALAEAAHEFWNGWLNSLFG